MTLDPKLLLFAIAGGFIPALVWLWFWLREDNKKPEPTRLILRAFLVGGLMVFPAFVLQRIVIPAIESAYGIPFSLALPEWSLTFFADTIPFLLAWALIEEFLKYFAVALVAYTSTWFDEPIDAMIYIITAAIGFAALENTLFIINAMTAGGTHISFLLTGNLRFLGATIIHIVSSAIIGASIALAFCSSAKTKIISFISGLIIATALHGVFNFFIIVSTGTQMFKIFLVLWITAIVVIYFFEKVKRVVCMPDFTKTPY